MCTDRYAVREVKQGCGNAITLLVTQYRGNRGLYITKSASIPLLLRKTIVYMNVFINFSCYCGCMEPF